MKRALFFYHIGSEYYSYLRMLDSNESSQGLADKLNKTSGKSEFFEAELIKDGIDLNDRVFQYPFNNQLTLHHCGKGYNFVGMVNNNQK